MDEIDLTELEASTQVRSLVLEDLQAQSCDLQQLISQTYRILAGKSYRGTIRVEYYPYTSVKSTIREREGALIVRISDILAVAPERVVKSLAYILICKLLKRSCPEHYQRCYADYINDPGVKAHYQQIRRSRGSKRHDGPKGRYYDLNEVFTRVSATYFDHAAPKPMLAWSKRETKRTFGTHDETFGLITISKSLDDPNVPEFVVEYVMYHELLHCLLGTRYVYGRRSVHGREFKRCEQAFKRYHEAEEWLKKFAVRKRRERSKRR